MTFGIFVFLLLGVLGRPAVADFGFLLLHTNDMHAHFQQTDKYIGICENDTTPLCYGGFARLHSQVIQKKQEAASKGLPTIFLNAGDSYQGTPFYTLFKWPIVAQFVSMLDLDVMSLGNHEFDDGVEGLAPYIRNVSVPIVTCNIDISLEPSLNQPNLTPSYILSVGNTKVGVIGYLTPETKTLSNIGEVKLSDEIPSIRAEAQRLLAENVTILIALGHSGYIVDQDIAREVEEIDIVVGGHSHTFLYTGTPPDIDKPKGPYPTVVTQASGKQVPVVQAFYGTKYLGYLEVYFDDQGNLKRFNGSPILLSGDMPQDPNILQALKPYEDKMADKIYHVVGYTSVLLDNNEMKCKLEECNIGNLITDAFVDFATRNLTYSVGWTVVSIGLTQSGGIRSSINTKTNVYHNGSITLGDLMTVFPWGGKVAVVDIAGEVLLQALEFSVARYEDAVAKHINKFLQISGLRVVYDLNKPSGHRAVKVSVLCATCDVPSYQPLQTQTRYRVVMPDYLAQGGDGFSMFANRSVYFVLGEIDYMMIADYITRYSPIHPTIEGRISIIGVGQKSSAPILTNSALVWMTAVFFLLVELNLFR